MATWCDLDKVGEFSSKHVESPTVGEQIEMKFDAIQQIFTYAKVC
jgi:hypothetical protein